MASLEKPKKLKDDSWSIKIKIESGSDSKGNRLPRINTCYRSKPGVKEKTAIREAELYAIELEDKVKRGIYIADKYTLGEYMDYVLDEKYANGYLKKNTYSEDIRKAKRIKRYIGNIKLNKLKPSDIDYMLSSIREEGNLITGEPLNNKTIKEYYLLVSATLDWAFEHGLVNENIAKRVRAPRIKKKETEFYDNEEITTILNAISHEQPRSKAFISVLFFTGLRKGEILGLEWKNLNESEGTITVEKTYNYNSTNGLFFDTPKTEKSKRTVCLPKEVVSILKEYKAWQLENQKLRFGEYFNDEGYIFTQDNGAPIHPDNVKRILEEVEKNHPEIPHLKCHKFRHSVASYLIYKGHDVATVSKMLGHSNIATTLNYYTHAIPQGQRELADTLSDLVKRA